MADLIKISNGELFADLQKSLADIALMEMLTNYSHKERYYKEKNIAGIIKAEIKQRFSEKQIMEFLINGYPRQVDLTNIHTTIRRREV